MGLFLPIGNKKDYEYYEQLYIKKLDNLDEIYKFLETQNLPTLENRNRPITSKNIKSVIKNIRTSKSSGPNGLTGKICQHLKNEC